MNAILMLIVIRKNKISIMLIM